MNKTILYEGLKILNRNIHVKLFGFKKYPGNDEDICRKIVDSCYNKNMYIRGVSKGCYNASSGNYKVFYSRDFGWCIESLIDLGYTSEVKNTISYILEKYSLNKGISVCIASSGKCFNFPECYSPDSVAYFFRSLRISLEHNIISKKDIFKYKDFLNSEIVNFRYEVLDDSGNIFDKNFSGMRDHIKNTKLCYDFIMACMLDDEIIKINKAITGLNGFLTNPFKKYSLKKILLNNYWNKKGYFNDSLDQKYCSGHANVYPYFLNVISDKKMLKSSINNIKKNKLDIPIVLKYGFDKHTKFLWYNMFSPDWEKTTSWAMLGLAYIDVVSKIDKKQALVYLNKYSSKINEYNCFIELYSGEKPYSSVFFSSDDSMLWASMYLSLKKKLKS